VDVVAAAGGARRGRRRWAAAAIPALAVGAAALLALAWPFGGSGPQGTILERAAAAIGDGPVLHAVIRQGWGGTLVDLESGERRKLHAETEIWHDPERGTHSIHRFDGVFQGDHVDPPNPRTSLDDYVGKSFAAIATGLRDGIRKGTARVLEDGAVEGEPVHWIRVDTKMLPDVEDGKLHEWAHDVAVSQETAEVVATRETRDGAISPDGIAVVLEAETLPAGAGDFTVDRGRPQPTMVEMGQGRTGLTLAEATSRLGRPALWAGPRVAGLDLATIWEDVLRIGTGRSGSWRDHGGVSLFYGVLDDDRNPMFGRYDFDGFVPEPYVRITETAAPPHFRVPAPPGYVPPEGSVHLSGHGRGVLHRDGIHALIEAPSDEVVLAVARALEPVPEG
jgi:hypothetical protein